MDKSGRVSLERATDLEDEAEGGGAVSGEGLAVVDEGVDEPGQGHELGRREPLQQGAVLGARRQQPAALLVAGVAHRLQHLGQRRPHLPWHPHQTRSKTFPLRFDVVEKTPTRWPSSSGTVEASPSPGAVVDAVRTASIRSWMARTRTSSDVTWNVHWRIRRIQAASGSWLSLSSCCRKHKNSFKKNQIDWVQSKIEQGKDVKTKLGQT